MKMNRTSPILPISLFPPNQQEGDQEKALAYRRLLIQAIHRCAVKFPDVADAAVHTLMDFLGGDGGLDVIVFVRCVPVLGCP